MEDLQSQQKLKKNRQKKKLKNPQRFPIFDKPLKLSMS